MDILPQLLVNALITGSIYALASCGLSLTYGLLGILNFAHGHLMMLGAYIFYYAHIQLGYGVAASALFTGIFCGTLSLLTLKVFVLPFSRANPIISLVTTLALANILEASISMVFGVNVKSLSSGTGEESIEWQGIFITSLQMVIIASALVVVSSIAFLIHGTSLGRKVRALAENTSGAQSLGISRVRVSYSVFAIGALVAALAGVLVGFETSLQPTMGSAYTIKAFAAMVLGGLGNVWGTIAGSYVLGLVENLAVGLEFGGFSIPAGYKDAFAFGIILLVLLCKPSGLGRRKARMV